MFESQAHHLSFYQFIFELCYVEKTIIEEAQIGPLTLKVEISISVALDLHTFVRFDMTFEIVYRFSSSVGR